MANNPTSKLSGFLFGRVLGVERHEYAAVAWSFGYFFCVLSSYYMIRPIRESMAVGSGPNTIPWLFTGTFALMMIATPIFGWIASRYPRRVFLPWIYVFFVSNILIFWGLFWNFINDGQDHVWLGRAFFVWLSIFNLFVVSVFWSFMADIYTREQGRRLFGVIAAGGSIGAILGSATTSLLVTDIGFHHILPISAIVLSFAVLCIAKLRKWVAQEHEVEITDTVDSKAPLGGDAFSGMTHVFRSKFFSGIAISSIIASLLGTALYIFAARLVEVEIADVDARTRFFSNMNVVSNFFSLVGQMFLVRTVVQRFGIGASLVLMPVVSIAGFALLAVDPLLSVVAFLTIARRAIGFSFSKTCTDMLYSVVTPEEKYKTKNFIDTAVYRFGDVVTVWTVNPVIVALGITGVSVMMLPFAAVWAGISLWLGSDYHRRARALRESGVS